MQKSADTPSPNSNPPTEAAMAAAIEIYPKFIKNVPMDDPSSVKAVFILAELIQLYINQALANVEGERDALKIELGAARSGITAWIGDIQSFNVALGLIPAAHRTETSEAISTLRADLAAKGEALSELIRAGEALPSVMTWDEQISYDKYHEVKGIFNCALDNAKSAPSAHTSGKDDKGKK